MQTDEVHLEHPESGKWRGLGFEYCHEVVWQPETSNQIPRPVVNNPNELAEAIKKKLEKESLPFIEEITIINGFINISIKNKWFVSQMERVLKEDEDYGKLAVLEGKNLIGTYQSGSD